MGQGQARAYHGPHLPVAGDQQRQSGYLYRRSRLRLQRLLHGQLRRRSTALNDAGTGFLLRQLPAGRDRRVNIDRYVLTSIGLDYVSELAGRYKTISPYVRDSYKVTSKAHPRSRTCAGIICRRSTNCKDRWTFLNPTMTNPLTGTPGILQFAGNYGGAGVSCGCTTPVPHLLEELGSARRHRLFHQ